MIDLRPVTRYGIYSHLGLEEVSKTKEIAEEDIKVYQRAFDNQKFRVVKVTVTAEEEGSEQ